MQGKLRGESLMLSKLREIKTLDWWDVFLNEKDFEEAKNERD